jgi:hypothetical protein
MIAIDWNTVVDFVMVALLGGAVGLGELVARYRDAPLAAVRSAPALLYLGLNAGAAVIALWLTRVFNWTFGIESTDPNALRFGQVLFAGGSALALFRTSLSFTSGNQELSLGLSHFLQTLVDAADREVDRLRGQSRAGTVARSMRGVSFEKAYVSLPTFCMALLQNLPPEEQEKLGAQTKALADAAIDPKIKSLLLGLSVMNSMGDGVLEAAIRSIGDELKPVPAPPP